MPAPKGKLKPSFEKLKARGPVKRSGVKALVPGSEDRRHGTEKVPSRQQYKVKATSIDEYATMLPVQVREAALAADAIMRGAHPLVRGAIKWGCPHYHVDGAPTKGWHHIMGGMNIKDVDGTPTVVLSLGFRAPTGEKGTREMMITSSQDIDIELLKRYANDAVALVQSL